MSKIKRCAGNVHPGILYTIITLGILTVLFLLLPGRKNANLKTTGKPLLVFCAAGIKPPVEAVAREYEKQFGVAVELQYGGSGTLLGNLRIAKSGDLFVAADDSYIEIAHQQKLIAEVIPLAKQSAVIAVRKGNPKQIKTIQDLMRSGVRVSLANPDAASIGSTLRLLLKKTGEWDKLEASVRQTGVFKPTVNEVANDLKLGAVDAGVIWDSTVRQYPELEMVQVPELAAGTQTVSIAVLNSTTQPTAALRFARFLGASDRGLKEFVSHHYEPVTGDVWALTPELTLFSGSMLRPAIEQTLKDFEKREGVVINTIYNGCGILTAQMRAGQRPDAYFACDTTFMKSVADLYLDSQVIAENEIIIITQKGNPLGIHKVEDLIKPGIKLGLAHPEKSAMGALTKTMLVAMGIYDAVCKNLLLDSPTGDFLVNQLRTGSLDVIIACRSNAMNVKDYVEVVAIDHPLAKAVQPYGVARQTRYQQTMTRLQRLIESQESRTRFESSGFYWKYESRSSAGDKK